jgi:hypothetical protein
VFHRSWSELNTAAGTLLAIAADYPEISAALNANGNRIAEDDINGGVRKFLPLSHTRKLVCRFSRRDVCILWLWLIMRDEHADLEGLFAAALTTGVATARLEEALAPVAGMQGFIAGAFGGADPAAVEAAGRAVCDARRWVMRVTTRRNRQFSGADAIILAEPELIHEGDAWWHQALALQANAIASCIGALESDAVNQLAPGEIALLARARANLGTAGFANG